MRVQQRMRTTFVAHDRMPSAYWPCVIVRRLADTVGPNHRAPQLRPRLPGARPMSTRPEDVTFPRQCPPDSPPPGYWARRHCLESPEFPKTALIAGQDCTLDGLACPTTEGAIEIGTGKTAGPEVLELIRYGAAHALAKTATELYPDVQVTIGPDPCRSRAKCLSTQRMSRRRHSRNARPCEPASQKIRWTKSGDRAGAGR